MTEFILFSIILSFYSAFYIYISEFFGFEAEVGTIFSESELEFESKMLTPQFTAGYHALVHGTNRCN